MRYSFKIFLALYFLSTIGNAQKIDVLLKKLKSSEDTSRVIILNKLSEAYAKEDIKSKKSKKPKADNALEYGLKALKYAEKIDYKKGIAVSYHNLGKIYLKKKNNREAELAFLNSVELAKELKEHELVLKNFTAIFKFHQELGNVSNALAYADMKSLYKDVMIKELNESKQKIHNENILALKQVSKLESQIKIKESKEKETQKALARIPETRTVIKYKIDYRLLGVALLIIAALSLSTYMGLHSKNDYKRRFKDAVAWIEKLEKKQRGMGMGDSTNGSEKGSIERTEERQNREISNYSNENSPTDPNLKIAQLLNHANYIVQKNDLLIELKNSFNGLKESKVEELSRQVLGIERFLNARYDTDNDWESFLAYFENAFPEYIANLKEKFSHLSDHEVKLLVLHKINLTKHEMASILHFKEIDIETFQNDLKDILKKEKVL